MLYKCIIVDDEEFARQLIETHLKQIDGFEVIASCGSAMEAHKVLLNREIDLMFLDIEMPGIKGTDFLRNIIVKPKVIFTTAYRDYALEGFELNAIDYLLKPIVFTRFFQAIEKFLQVVNKPIKMSLSIEDNDYIYVKNNKKNIKVNLQEINYIESIKDYIKIHMLRETITIKHSLSAFEDKLDKRFLRIHRSYIVNTHKITAFTKVDIEIDKIELPIGDSYKAFVYSRLGN